MSPTAYYAKLLKECAKSFNTEGDRLIYIVILLAEVNLRDVKVAYPMNHLTERDANISSEPSGQDEHIFIQQIEHFFAHSLLYILQYSYLGVSNPTSESESDAYPPPEDQNNDFRPNAFFARTVFRQFFHEMCDKTKIYKDPKRIDNTLPMNWQWFVYM